MSGRFGRKAIFDAAMLATMASIVSYAAGMVVSILIARSLGPTEYGQYAYVVWLSGLMIALASSGFNASAMRFISEYVGAEQPVTSVAIHRRLRRQVLVAVGGACVLLAVIWPWVRPQGTESISATLLLIAIVGFSTKALFMFESAAAKGYGRFWIEAAVLSSLAIVNVVGVVALWDLHAELGPFLGWFAFLSVAHLMLVAVLVRRQRTGAEAPAALDDELRGRVSRHLRWGIVLSVVGVLGSRSFETFLLNAHADAREVGFFSIAVMLTRSGVDLLAGGLSSVMIPVMSHALGAGGRERLRKVFVDATRYYQFVGLMLGGMGYFWAEPAVILMYGERYRPVVFALQALVTGACLMMPNGGLTALLSATENQKLRVAFSVVSVSFSAAMAFLLVPTWGLNGALASVILSQWPVYMVGVVLIDRWLGFRLPYASLGRQVGLAAVAAVAGAFVLRLQLGLWANVLAGLTYLLILAGGSIFVGIWSVDERQMARRRLAQVPVLRRWA